MNKLINGDNKKLKKKKYSKNSKVKVTFTLLTQMSLENLKIDLKSNKIKKSNLTLILKLEHNSI
jgi:hypothetical protein